MYCGASMAGLRQVNWSVMVEKCLERFHVNTLNPCRFWWGSRPWKCVNLKLRQWNPRQQKDLILWRKLARIVFGFCNTLWRQWKTSPYDFSWFFHLACTASRLVLYPTSHKGLDLSSIHSELNISKMVYCVRTHLIRIPACVLFFIKHELLSILTGISN